MKYILIFLTIVLIPLQSIGQKTEKVDSVGRNYVVLRRTAPTVINNRYSTYSEIGRVPMATMPDIKFEILEETLCKTAKSGNPEEYIEIKSEMGSSLFQIIYTKKEGKISLEPPYHIPKEGKILEPEIFWEMIGLVMIGVVVALILIRVEYLIKKRKKNKKWSKKTIWFSLGFMGINAYGSLIFLSFIFGKEDFFISDIQFLKAILCMCLPSLVLIIGNFIISVKAKNAKNISQ